jgi:hypothetical protein
MGGEEEESKNGVSNRNPSRPSSGGYDWLQLSLRAIFDL